MNLKQARLQSKLAGLRKKREKANKVQKAVIDIQIRALNSAINELHTSTLHIRNQKVVNSKEYIEIVLNQPYWGAWKKYGWERGIEGYGISKEIVNKARDEGKKIKIKLNKYGNYEISAKMVLKKARKFYARDKKLLYVVPRTACKKCV